MCDPLQKKENMKIQSVFSTLPPPRKSCCTWNAFIVKSKKNKVNLTNPSIAILTKLNLKLKLKVKQKLAQVKPKLNVV